MACIIFNMYSVLCRICPEIYERAAWGKWQDQAFTPDAAVYTESGAQSGHRGVGHE